MKTLRTSLFITILFLFSACNNPPVKGLVIAGKYKKACVPESAAMVSALNKCGVKAKMLIFGTGKRSHAITIYLFPNNKNQILWGWDSSYSSNRIKAYWNDSDQIATYWLRRVELSTEKLSYSQFVE